MIPVPPKPLYYFSNLPQIVVYNPSVGKFELNTSWSPAYSGYNATQRVRRNRDFYRQSALAEIATHASDVSGGAYKTPSELYGSYKPPETDDEAWDQARVEADVLNAQLQTQAMEAQQEEPSGWRGVIFDALNNPAGGALTRSLDILGRPGYAVQAGLKGELRAVRGESADHPGWVPLQPGGIETHLNPETGQFERLDSDYNRRQEGGQFWKDLDTGKIERHDDWQASPEGGRTQRAIAGFAHGAREGATGRDKASFGQFLREADWLKGKPAAVVGLAGDIAFDPTTHVSFGTSTVARKGGLGALGAGEREALELTARQAAERAVEEGAVKGPLAARRAYRTALRETMEAEGITRRPVREVIKDINSSYGEHSTERAMRDRVAEALKDPFWGRSTQRRIAREARDVAKAEAAATGRTLTAKEIKEAGQTALRRARSEFTDKVGADVLDDIATRRALRENLNLDVKLAGRTVLSSRTGGRAIAASSRAIRGTRLGGTLARTFRTDAEVGEALHRIRRQYYNTSASQFESEAREVKRVFTDLGVSRRQRTQIARALESGDTKGFTPAMVEGYDKAREFFRAAFDREVEAGALGPEDFKDNYLYHVYRNPGFSRGLGSWVKPISGGSDKFRTLAEAEAAGARPLTDVADVLVHRLAKSHRVASSHLMMREIAARFGVDLSGKGTAATALRQLEKDGLLVKASRIKGGVGRFFDKGVYFDQDVAASLSKMEQIFSNDEMISRFGRLFDNVQARLKFLQTAPNPGFHVRNTMSDMFVNFLDGVTSPTPYRRAMRLVTRTGNLDRAMVVLRDGTKLSGNDIIQLYEGMGLRAGFFHAEANIIPGMGRKYATGSENIVRQVSEVREDLMRMAHFVDALGKAPKMSRVEEVAEMAAKRVRKYNFDYQDLTNIEKRVFRRAVPFYTFMRKNVPLMLESYFTQPGRMIVPTKGNNALASFMGQDNRDEALPGMVNATPEWMRVLPGAEVVSQGPERDAVFMQPDMPYNQLEELFGGFAAPGSPAEKLGAGSRQFLKQILLEQSTALVRGPAEYATQTDLASGADVPQKPLDALINQLPVGRILHEPLASGLPSLFTASDRPGAPTYTVRVAGRRVRVSETVANYVTGLGFRKVTPQRMQSELRRRQDIIEAILRRIKEENEKEAEEEWNDKYGDLYGETGTGG